MVVVKVKSEAAGASVFTEPRPVSLSPFSKLHPHKHTSVGQINTKSIQVSEAFVSFP